MLRVDVRITEAWELQEVQPARGDLVINLGRNKC